MRYFFFQILLFVFPMIVLSQTTDIPKQTVYQVRDKMEIQSLNGTWKFKFIEGKNIPSSLQDFTDPAFDVAGWDNITVPGNWETQGFKTPEYGANIAECLGLYRTTFKANQAWKEKHTIIRFDGVLFGYELYVNGHYAGKWGSSFNPCQFDITPYIRFDRDNVLAVKVTTRTMGWRFDLNDCWALAGIFRDVELFSVPDVHLRDVTFVSKLERNDNAKLSFCADVSAFKTPGAKEKYKTQILLFDKTGKQVCAFSSPVSLKDNSQSLSFETSIENPKLWTAETPYLYTMEVRIVNDKNVAVQQIREKVGIREITVQGGILMVNNKPVRFHGACHNEIDPLTGRALTDTDRYKQLTMMKNANVNFIRTAHYPFHPNFHRMCDELGIYVCCEVPFGYGDSNLYKDEYAPELCTRAEATLTRDKNHPSIIMWTIGNENPYTDVVEKAVQYVKQKDPTRPRALPMAGGYFMKNYERLGDNLDIYAFHYQSAKSVAEIADLHRKPVITTEYSHALGLAFDALESQFDTILSRKNIAGGSVWCWSDQALLRNRTKEEFMKDSVVMGVWKDSIRYMDSFTDKGTDGIVYADGYPQEDYWQLRKVYSPIIVTDKEIVIRKGTQQIKLSLENRFDFISLKGYTCNWQVRNLSKELCSGIIEPVTPARDKEVVTLPVNIPDNILYNDCMLYLSFTDKQGNPVYEKSIRLLIDGDRPDYVSEINSSAADKSLKFKKSPDRITAQGKTFSCTIDRKGKIILKDSAGRRLIESDLLLRVGRKPSINMVNFEMRRKEAFYWNPYMLSPEIKEFSCSELNGKIEARLLCRWNRVEKQGEYVEGTVTISISKNGTVAFEYDLKPFNATGTLWECGLSLSLNQDIETFRWLGYGPFTSTPGKTAYNERDIWALHKDDISFLGNRGKVDVAALLDSCNTGIGFIGQEANLAVENIDGSVYISDNAIVSSYGTKLSSPIVECKADKIEAIKGKFILTVIGENKPSLFDSIFGSYPEVLPEMPFLKSYGH